ncbi:hypothetical protein NKDENANG_04078 [Candidatus Entotheonellaceae bacterium PAL068K]
MGIPVLVAGQTVGGAIQGLSGAVWEERRYGDSGQLLTATFRDYLLLTAADIPTVEATSLGDTPCRLNPLGVKGVGERGITGMGTAVAHAVADALGPLGAKVTEDLRGVFGGGAPEKAVCFTSPLEHDDEPHSAGLPGNLRPLSGLVTLSLPQSNNT